MTENKTISISYLNSNTWMIFSILRSLQSLLQISRISNWQPSSLKWQAGSMGQITYKTQQTKQKNIKRSSGAETLTSSHKNPDSSLFLKTQKIWQHNTRIPTWPQSAMAEQVPPPLHQTYLVLHFANYRPVAHLSDSECVTIATHRGDMASIYSLYRYMSHALSYYVL